MVLNFLFAAGRNETGSYSSRACAKSGSTRPLWVQFPERTTKRKNVGFQFALIDKRKRALEDRNTHIMGALFNAKKLFTKIAFV
jgi:hypothetical protein